MRAAQIALAGASLLSSALAAPAHHSSAASSSGTAVPDLNDGFPDFNPQQLLAVQDIAHGTLSNGPPPPQPGPQGILNLQLIQLNENTEVAFFSELIFNITTGVTGYEISDASQKEYILNAFKAILAQEELHATNARNALTLFKQTVIEPCSVSFPVTNFEDAVALAATFTDLVLGTLQDVINVFANEGDKGLPGAVGSVIGQEGEQEGFFRILQNKNLIPSALPFLTASARDFAVSALNGFITGQCAGVDVLTAGGLKLFAPLTVVTPNIQPKAQTLTFTVDIADLKDTKNIDFSSFSSSQYGSWSSGKPSNLGSFDWDNSGLYLQYINQQNMPISEPLTNVKVSGTKVTFDAYFPFSASNLNSLTIAAVTVGTNFTTVADVVNAALFAPGLIEVN